MNIFESRKTDLTMLVVAVVIAGFVSAGHAAAPPKNGKGFAIKEKLVKRRGDKKGFKKALETTIDFPGIEDEKTTLLDALDQLARQHGLTFLVNERAFKSEMIEEVLKLKVAAPLPVVPTKTTLQTVLKKILARIPSPSGAILVLRCQAIEITTQSAWLRELGLPQDTKSPLLVKHFRKTPLNKALAAVREEMGGLNVLIDVRIEKKTRVKVTARLDHVPIETVVELLADTAGLAVFEKDGVFYITSPANAERLKKENARRTKAETESESGREPTGLLLTESWRKGITLNKALTAKAREAGVNLLIDPRIEKKTSVRVTARLFAPVRTTLELLADMAGLAVVKKANVYYVTSPTNAERLRKEEARRQKDRRPVEPDVKSVGR